MVVERNAKNPLYCGDFLSVYPSFYFRTTQWFNPMLSYMDGWSEARSP